MAIIGSVEWGKITINKKEYFSDMYVYWDGKTEMRAKSRVFTIDELVKLLRKNPETIIIGTGLKNVLKIPEDVLQVAEDKNIKLIIEPTKNALEVFNALAGDGKKAIAVLHTY